MKETYQSAINQVFKSEGGYTNEATDPGGPTNWGITIHDARQFWKPDATADDVRTMPKSIAEDIYRKHYADVIWYDRLPPGIDYTVLDYAINSGVSKSIKTLQEVVNAPVDGIMGTHTLAAVDAKIPEEVISKIWAERLAYNQSLPNWPTYKRGWTTRNTTGKQLAMSLLTQFLTLFKGNTTMPANQTEAPAHPTTSTATAASAVPFQFDPETFLQDIEQALEAANTMLPALLPVIGAFYPPAAALTKFLPLIPVVLGSVQQVQTQLGGTPSSSVTAVQNHLTPGQPNSPALN